MTKTDDMKSHNKKGIARLKNALIWSLSGLKKGFKDEAAFRQEVILFIILIPLALWLSESKVERCLMIGSLFLVLIVELLNSGIEAAVDRISEENHPLSGKAKDIGSAAVFLSLLNAGVIWAIILLF